MTRTMRVVAALVAFVLLGSTSLASTAVAQEASPAAAVATPAAYDRTGWPEQLSCGLFGGDDAEAALEGGEPLAAYLEQWLDLPVEYTVGTSYNAVIESMRAGHTNCGTVGPFSYVLAVQEAGAEALAVEVYPGTEPAVYDPTLIPAYFSVISTIKGNGIDSVDDFRDRTFAFVDPASTSGFLIPSSEFVEVGITPDEDMETIFAGSHPTSALALWNKKVDGAASTESTLYNLAAEGQIDFCPMPDGIQGKIRTPEEVKAVYDACPDGSVVILQYSDPIPNTPFAVSSSLPQTLKDAITDALVSIKDHPDLVAELGYWYVDPTADPNSGITAVDQLYDPLRVIAQQLGLDLKSFGS